MFKKVKFGGKAVRYAGLTAGAVGATLVQNAVLSKVEFLQKTPILKNLATGILGVGLGMAAGSMKSLKKNASLVEAIGDGMYVLSSHNLVINVLRESVPEVAKTLGIAGAGDTEFIVAGMDDLGTDGTGVYGTGEPGYNTL